MASRVALTLTWLGAWGAAAQTGAGEGTGADTGPPSGSERILDPENPGPLLPTEPDPVEGTGETSLPDPAASEDTPAVSAGPSWVQGAFRSSVYFDTARESSAEDLFGLHQRLELGARGSASEHVRIALEGRLDHWLWAAQTPNEAGTDTALSWHASAEANLRDAYVSIRFDPMQLRVGNQTVVWGAGTLSQPGAVVNPVDLRHGQLGRPAETRLPIPAAELSLSVDRTSLSAVVVPFFFPHYYDIRGNDFAVFTGTQPPGVLTLYDSLLPMVDDTLQDEQLDLAAITERPEPTLPNTSVGARLASSPGPFDLGVAWFYGWDRMPFITRTPASPERDFTSRYLRMHVVEADLVAVIGDFALRLEAAFSPERTIYAEYDPLEGLPTAPGEPNRNIAEARRRAVVDAAGALSWDRSEHVFAQVEVLWRRAFTSDPGAVTLFGGNDLSLLGLVRFGLAEIEALRGGLLSNLSFSVWSVYGLTRSDWILFSSLSWRFSDAARLSLGIELFGGPDTEEDLTVGGLYDNNDQLVTTFDLSF